MEGEDMLRSVRRTVASTVVVAALAFGLVSAASADVVGPLDFESYTAGTIHGQDGWSSSGAAGSGCAVYDHAVALTSAFAGAPTSFGTKSLRMSNAVTSGCFGDQTFSKSLVDEAGESSAGNGGLSGGTRQAFFSAEWSFWSTVPGVEQPGLSVVASPDRGDGARMSWIQMADTPTGLAVNFYDYRDLEPYGDANGDANGCGSEDNFFFAPVAGNLDRSVPHTVRVIMRFAPGPRNDVVYVFVDGVLGYTGTSWEDYFRYCEGNPTRTVDSVLLRTGGTAAPATAGNGFLIDALTMKSGSAPSTKDGCKDGGWATFFKSQGDCIQYATRDK